MLTERHVKSVVLTQHPELWAWVQETLPNFSNTCVKLLYALRRYHQRTNSTAAALDALLEDIARSGRVSDSDEAVNNEPLRLIIRQELQRATISLGRSQSFEPAQDDAAQDDAAQLEMAANLEAIL